MLPPDPMIAYSQTKAMIAERHADSARHRLAAVTRTDARRSAASPLGAIARRLVAMVRHPHRPVADRTQAVPSSVAGKSGAVAG